MFLEKLTTHAEEVGPLSLQTLENMDLIYGLTSMGNAEIKLRCVTVACPLQHALLALILL